MQNVVITKFDVESEAYQAFVEFKNDCKYESCKVNQMSIVRKENGAYRVVDTFNDGKYVDDTYAGGLIGMLVGILGGPLGVLLGWGVGTLGGMAVDGRDLNKDKSMVEHVVDDVEGDCTFLAGLVTETAPDMYNSRMGKFKQTTTRYDAKEMMAEVEELKKTEKDLEKQARKEVRQKKAEGFFKRSGNKEDPPE